MLQTACRNLVRSSFHCLIPRLRRRAITFTLALSVTTFGCVTRPQTWQKTVRNDTTEVDRVTDQIDNPAPTIFHEASHTGSPVTAEVISANEVSYVDRNLDEVLRDALQYSTVMRDAGGVILRGSRRSQNHFVYSDSAN